MYISILLFFCYCCYFIIFILREANDIKMLHESINARITAKVVSLSF